MEQRELFWQANQPTYIPKLPDGFIILTYNVHFFTNLNPDISVVQNYIDIKNLVKSINADIIILQEVVQDINFKGYHSYKCENGASKMYIKVFSKVLYDHKVLDLTIYGTKREVIILETDFGKLACVHLEIEPRNEGGVLNRLNQLKSLSKYDLIIGDCNFVVGGKEHKYLLKEGFEVFTEPKNSTPFNRVDLCYAKKESFQVFTLTCNLSDHLPVCFVK